MPLINCSHCGEEFSRKLSQILKYKNSFCSKNCHNKFQQKENEISIKENNAEIIIKHQIYGNKIVLIDIEDVEKINTIKWHLNFDKTINGFYVRGWQRISQNKRKNISIHRFLMNFPEKMQIDHENGNTLDNRKDNLRVVSQKQNQENIYKAYSNSKSGIRGVHWNKSCSKWLAVIRHNNKIIKLGYFKEIKEAEKTVIEARLKYFTHSEMDKKVSNV